MAKSFGYFLQKKVSGIFIAFFHGSLKKIMIDFDLSLSFAASTKSFL